jgi:hypothetical protein
VAAVLPEYFAAAKLNGAMPDEELSMMGSARERFHSVNLFAKLQEQ